MINKYLVLPVLFSIILSGCGGSGDKEDELILGDLYDKKPGDVFTTSRTINLAYSNGQNAEVSATGESTYSDISDIPSKYDYSNSNNGPYVLETFKIDDEPFQLFYMTESGDSIIDDDFEFFSSVEYRTESGKAKPENIYMGDEFSYNINSTLFDSQSGVEAGYEIQNIDFTVLKVEQLIVPAGSFNAVKIGYSFSSTTSENAVVNTMSETGYVWFDTTNGFLLKEEKNGNMTLNELSLTATFSAETILQSYSISQNKSAKNSSAARAGKNSSLIDINPLFIYHNIKQNIQKLSLLK